MIWVVNNLSLIWDLTLQHLWLSIPPIVLGLVISIPLGWLAYRFQLTRGLLQVLAQRLGVVEDGCLRFTRGHQALQVAQNRGGLRAGLLVLLQQGLQAFLQLRVTGRVQAQLGAAADERFGDELEGVQVLAQQEHRLGADAFLGQELVGALADTLGQHHQLAHCRQLGRRGVLLQLQG